jgi:arylsulfatase
VPSGDHQVRLEFTYDGGGLGKGATADLYVDGAQVATGRVDATQPLAFSGDETLDVGSESATPVSDDYDSRGSGFTGRIHQVQIDLGEDAEDNDHLISPEERLRIITTRQ